MCKLIDVSVLKILPAGENAAQQDGRVHRRNLGFPYPFAGVDVRKMIEESAMRGYFVPQERERLHNPQTRLSVLI